MIIRKLSTSQILKYIQQCRRQNNVLEPTLSLMYQMRMLDEQVVKVTGFFISRTNIHPYASSAMATVHIEMSSSRYTESFTVVKAVEVSSFCGRGVRPSTDYQPDRTALFKTS